MKKLILASVFFAIFLLEVAFGVYVAFERRFEYELSRDTKFADIQNSVAGVEVETLRIADPHFSQPDISDRAPSGKVVNRVRNTRSQPESREYDDSKNRASASLSKSKFANYKSGAGVLTGPRKQIQTVGAQKTPSTEIIRTKYAPKETKPTNTSRSLMAIFKKPIDWIKSVGSKLR